MVSYIILVTLTEKGRQNFAKSYNTSREELRKQVTKLGGKLTGYVTTGPYDAVEIIELPNDDVALGVLLRTLSVDEIRTLTLRAFHEDEVKKTLRAMT